MGRVKYRVIEKPSTEPVTLEDAKLHLRLNPDDDIEDEPIIRPIISAAREFCENITGRALVPQKIAAYPDANQRVVKLPMPPATQIDKIKAYMADGTEATLPPSAYYFDQVDGIVLLEDVPDGIRALNPIEITYQAGESTVPFSVRQAILLLIGHWYENREAVVVGAIASIEVNVTVQTLLNQYKAWWF